MPCVSPSVMSVLFSKHMRGCAAMQLHSRGLHSIRTAPAHIRPCQHGDSTGYAEWSLTVGDARNHTQHQVVMHKPRQDLAGRSQGCPRGRKPGPGESGHRRASCPWRDSGPCAPAASGAPWACPAAGRRRCSPSALPCPPPAARWPLHMGFVSGDAADVETCWLGRSTNLQSAGFLPGAVKYWVLGDSQLVRLSQGADQKVKV